MSETVIVSFRIQDGVITDVTEYRSRWQRTFLSGRRDIERAVARVANAPVGGREELSEERQ